MERRRLLNQCAAGAGTSPITRRSGKRKSVHARFVHNDRLLDALMLQAQSALRASPAYAPTTTNKCATRRLMFEGRWKTSAAWPSQRLG